MKYIRTKDRIIEVKKMTIHDKLTGDYIHEKLADTVEELCDEFVIYDSEQNNGLPITCPKERLTEIKPYIQIGMQKQFNCWLKGAIWTDKGLIYVAKMTSKGELELL